MLFDCPNLAVPADIMQHVIYVESSGNPYAIGVVGGKLQRQPNNLAEAVATAEMLEKKGYNFSIGIAQINRYNLSKYGLKTYKHAFQVCPNIQVGSRILRECFDRSRDWGKSFSCYYSGNFVTGFRHGYVQKIFSSIKQQAFPRPPRQQTGKINIPYHITAPARHNMPTGEQRHSQAAAPAHESSTPTGAVKNSIYTHKQKEEQEKDSYHKEYNKNEKVSHVTAIAKIQPNNNSDSTTENLQDPRNDRAFVF